MPGRQRNAWARVTYARTLAGWLPGWLAAVTKAAFVLLLVEERSGWCRLLGEVQLNSAKGELLTRWAVSGTRRGQATRSIEAGGREGGERAQAQAQAYSRW